MSKYTAALIKLVRVDPSVMFNDIQKLLSFNLANHHIEDIAKIEVKLKRSAMCDFEKYTVPRKIELTLTILSTYNNIVDTIASSSSKELYPLSWWAALLQIFFSYSCNQD